MVNIGVEKEQGLMMGLVCKGISGTKMIYCGALIGIPITTVKQVLILISVYLYIFIYQYQYPYVVVLVSVYVGKLMQVY